MAAYPTRIPAIPHSLGPWQHASAAGTPYREWKVTRGCIHCSFTETRLAAQLDPSQLPEGMPDPNDPGTVPTTPATTPSAEKEVEPAELSGVSIVIIAIAVVALCFVGVEVCLVRRKNSVRTDE